MDAFLLNLSSFSRLLKAFRNGVVDCGDNGRVCIVLNVFLNAGTITENFNGFLSA